MTAHRPNVPPATRQALRDQAGGKCANPGCPVARTHLHHIREWAVYQSHDGRHMIAVCPTCHDAIHHGALEIDDDTLYRWKSITRTDEAKRGHLYVEPGRQAKLLLGSVAVTGDAGLIVFDLSEGNRLSFALQDDEIILLSLRIADMRGREVVRLTDGYVKVDADTGVDYRHVAGHHLITAPVEPRFVPGWVRRRVQVQEPEFTASESVILLDLEVVEPGVVKVQGLWLEREHGIIITAERLHSAVMHPARPGTVSIAGAGVDTVLHYTGPITTALFGFGDAAAGVLDLQGSTPDHPRPSSAIHRW